MSDVGRKRKRSVGDAESGDSSSNEDVMTLLRSMRKELKQQTSETKKLRVNFEILSESVNQLKWSACFKEMNPWLEMAETERSRMRDTRAHSRYTSAGYRVRERKGVAVSTATLPESDVIALLQLIWRPKETLSADILHHASFVTMPRRPCARPCGLTHATPHRTMVAGDTGKSPSELVRPFRGKNIATAFVLGGTILSICMARHGTSLL